MTLADPPRLTEDAAVSADLREALRGARTIDFDADAAARVREGVEQATTASTSTLPTVLKGLGLLAVLAAIAGLGSAAFDTEPNTPPAVAPTEIQPSTPTPAITPTADPDPDPDPDPEPEPEPEPEPDLESTPDPPKRSPAAPKPKPAAAAVAEAKLLLAARRALARDPSHALALTRKHVERYPDGALAEERELIAIRALMATGRVDAAKKRGRRFFTRYPASGHRPAVESALEID